MRLLYILALSLSASISPRAQTNYVANAANAYSTGTNNTLVGPQAGSNSINGIDNSIIGYRAGYNLTSGVLDTFVGSGAGYTTTTAQGNTFIGADAGYNTVSGLNSFIGSRAGFNNTNGFLNCFLGNTTGYSNTTGSANCFIGTGSGFKNNAGSANSFFGTDAGNSNTTGANNTFLGFESGKNVTTGSNNIIIGPTSGRTITDGSDNVLMGYNSQAEDGLHNATAIGAGSYVATSNAMVLGNGVNVGIGISAPAVRLHVRSGQADKSGFRLADLTSNSPTDQSTDAFLTVNAQGDVIKARYQLRISDVSQWSDKVFSPTYQLRPIDDVAAYVNQQGHLPGIPSAEQVQQDGIDLVKMNSLLLEKIEELTLYTIRLEKASQDTRQRDQSQQQRIEKLERAVQEFLQKK
ncbi:hypothetical protein [Spirosoma lituiforme]